MANQRPWTYLVNPIISVTDGSYRLAVRVSNVHLEALKSKAGDPFFDALILSYEPLNTELNETYSLWKAQGGSQLGQTLSLSNLLLLLKGTKIKQWDIAIQGVYDNTTQQYKSLLPHGRAIFQHGTQTDILTAVHTLAGVSAKFPALQTTSTDVASFYTQLQTAFDAQKKGITTTKTSSGAVEAARVAMCIGQYANLGALIQKYAADTHQVEPYFDLAALRDGSQVLFTGSIKPDTFKNILVHTFAPGDELKLSAEGSSINLQFYLAAQKEEAPNGTLVVVPAGQTLTAAASQLGAAGNRFLNVHNADGINKGEWTVEFV